MVMLAEISISATYFDHKVVWIGLAWWFAALCSHP
jgi:hypothetical protein